MAGLAVGDDADDMPESGDGGEDYSDDKAYEDAVKAFFEAGASGDYKSAGEALEHAITLSGTKGGGGSDDESAGHAALLLMPHKGK